MSIELSIVSGTYKRLPLLKNMVNSVRRSVPLGVSYEIVLVGVEGDQETYAWCSKQRDIRYVQQQGLQGAISAFNQGCAMAKGRYVILGNDDLEWVGDSIARALVYMHEHPGVGIGCFFTDRAGRGKRVDMMPAHRADGSKVSVPYGGIIIIPRWLGDALAWWTLPGARTYGGDNALCARCIEAGWPVIPLEGCQITEKMPDDELQRTNNPPTSSEHPDTAAYLVAFPNGPQLGNKASVFPPGDFRRPQRILYAPIYEEGHKAQHEQKIGLRRALQRQGLVWEVDYQDHNIGPDSILRVAELWKPDFVLLQLQYAEPFTPQHAASLRRILPHAKIVNWNGDVYNRSDRDDYCQMLTHFDLHTVVNATPIPVYEMKGVRTAFWQNAYEPDGVGYEALPDTPKHDVLFLGNAYSDKRHVFGKLLASLPYNVGVYGDYWQFDHNPPNLYDFRAGCRLYRNAKVTLSDSQWAHEAEGFVSNRLFQAMAAGNTLMMQQAFDGLDKYLGLIDGLHLVIWQDEADLREKLAYYLDPAHEEERAQIARAGQNEVLRNHSYEHRLLELMALLQPRTAIIDPVLAAFHEVISRG